MVSTHITKALMRVIRLYQLVISPLFSSRCRFYPTCSCYAIDALYWHKLKGLFFIAKRLMRCHPFGAEGVDFVPIPLYRLCFLPSGHPPYCVFLDKYSYRYHLGKRFAIKG